MNNVYMYKSAKWEVMTDKNIQIVLNIMCKWSFDFLHGNKSAFSCHAFCYADPY